jgi:hypothetical protein
MREARTLAVVRDIPGLTLASAEAKMRPFRAAAGEPEAMIKVHMLTYSRDMDGRRFSVGFMDTEPEQDEQTWENFLSHIAAEGGSLA